MHSSRNFPKEIEPFLKEIVAHPTDVLPRLVFADWLEEHGEPWSNFVRAEVALATDNLNPTERAVLTSLAKDLYWKHHRYWNGQVYRQWIRTPLAGKRVRENGLRGWHYRRGFPEILDVNAAFFVEHAELFLGAAPFREVILRRPPQPLSTFLTAHESILIRLEKLILTTMPVPNANELLQLPAGLLQRIRIGSRAQQTLPDYVSNPSNTQIVLPPSVPAVATPASENVNTHATPTMPPASDNEGGRKPSRSLLQILGDIWRRIRSRP
jgi:uncharacterized protein (TIGR02996 family)